MKITIENINVPVHISIEALNTVLSQNASPEYIPPDEAPPVIFETDNNIPWDDEPEADETKYYSAYEPIEPLFHTLDDDGDIKIYKDQGAYITDADREAALREFLGEPEEEEEEEEISLEDLLDDNYDEYTQVADNLSLSEEAAIIIKNSLGDVMLPFLNPESLLLMMTVLNIPSADPAEALSNVLLSIDFEEAYIDEAVIEAVNLDYDLKSYLPQLDDLPRCEYYSTLAEAFRLVFEEPDFFCDEEDC